MTPALAEAERNTNNVAENSTKQKALCNEGLFIMISFGNGGSIRLAVP